MHSFSSSPENPHGQGFIAAISIIFAGNVQLPEALEIVITPSSSGCLRTSNVFCGNSANSSRKSTPLWEREISPGCGGLPPPTIATPLAVW